MGYLFAPVIGYRLPRSPALPPVFFFDAFNVFDEPILDPPNANRWYRQQPNATGIADAIMIQNRLRIGGANIQIIQFPTALYPTAVQLPLAGRAQYCQFTFSERVFSSDPVAYLGPAVMFSGDLPLVMRPTTVRGYYLELRSDAATSSRLFLKRLGPGDATTTLAGPSLTPFTAGQVFRIEARPGAAANSLRCFLNGVKIFDVVDASADRVPVSGAPVIYAEYLRAWSDSSDYVWIDDFECGSL